MLLVIFSSLLQLLCYSKKSHSHTGDAFYYRWTWPSESRSALYQHLRITTLGHAFPKSHRSSTGSYHRFLTCCISYKWVYSSTVTDWAIIHISQQLKSSSPGKHKVYWGQHVRYPHWMQFQDEPGLIGQLRMEKSQQILCMPENCPPSLPMQVHRKNSLI